MGTIHKFTGDWKNIFKWDGSRTRAYHANNVNQVTETWLIGKAEKAENFAFRYYQVGPDGYTREEQHPHDHGILIMQGKGEILIDKEITPVSQGDVIYIPPNALHQLINPGENPLGFLCVIPAKRRKGNKVVWAEEGISFD